MELTANSFCPNVKNISDSMRTAYICKLTGKICPKVDYSSGKALPSKYFVQNGCLLLVKEEEKQIVEEVKEVVEKVETTQKKAEEPVNEIVEEKVGTIENKIPAKNQKTNNYKKKTNNKKK